MVVVGSGEIDSQILKNTILRLGTIDDERILALSYASADVLILPSLEDNLPNTMIEANLCGTPVIAFPIGGIPDAIIDGKNGYIAEEVSVKALKEVLNKFLNQEQIFDKQSIANDAKIKYNLGRQAEEYRQLFEAILSKKTK